jgi:hypothetical protein
MALGAFLWNIFVEMIELTGSTLFPKSILLLSFSPKRKKIEEIKKTALMVLSQKLNHL